MSEPLSKAGKPFVFVITGGPGAGKTESRPYLQSIVERHGFHLVFIPESATELIAGGLGADRIGNDLDYQKLQLSLQQSKEDLFCKGAENLQDKPVIVVCDRGMLDGAAWCSDAVWKQVLAFSGFSEEDLLNRYDGIFHMESAAVRFPQLYTCSNNEARIAKIFEAARQDRTLQKIYGSHPNWHLIEAEPDQEKKMQHLADQIIAQANRLMLQRKACPVQNKAD